MSDRVENKVFVLGAAGFLGLSVVEALSSRGVRPACGRRRRTNVLALRRRFPQCPRVRADLDDLEGLVAALSGYHTVIHAAGHYPRLSVDRDTILQTGSRQLRNALDAAASAGVKRFIYISSTATVAPRADGQPSTEGQIYSAPPGFGPYHDLKWEMERIAQAEDRFELGIALPSGCLGPWDLKVGTSALLVGLAHGLDLKLPDGPVNLVDVRDVGEGVVRMMEQSSVSRRMILSGSTHSLHAMLTELAPRYGVAPPAPPLSDDEAIAFANAEEHKAAGGGGRPRLSREIADLIVHGVPVRATLAEQLLGLTWTPLDQTLDAWEAWARKLGIIPKLEPA